MAEESGRGTAQGAPQGPSGRTMLWGVAAAALLAVAGGAAFYYASLRQPGAAGGNGVSVTVTSSACRPNELTVPAGERSFEIVNESDRPVEWEILDGVMVVAERENIAPGFRQTLKAKLASGDYEMTCGLLSNPRGVLHVTPSEEAAVAAAQPTLRKLIGPLSEYKVYLVRQGKEMVDAVEALDQAIAAGDLEKARALYEPARLPYKRIEPVAYRFSDLQTAIDPVADYLEKREQDPRFTGFHRIEYGLFEENGLDGLKPVADRLLADVTALKDRLREVRLTPDLLTSSAASMASRLAGGRLEAGENHYAHTDLADIEANLDGIAKIVDLLQPVLEPADPQLSGEIGESLGAARARLEDLKGEDGFPAYDTVDEDTRAALAGTFQDLAKALDKLPDAIGTGS